MKSPVIFNLIFSVLLSVTLFFVFPAELVSSNAAIAAGVILGGLIIPMIVTMFTQHSLPLSEGTDSNTTLYVGNLPYKATEQAVKEHFASLGKVHSVRLMKDRRTGKRKGYGFVEIATADAHKVIDTLNDTEFQERTLKVRLAKEKSGGE